MRKESHGVILRLLVFALGLGIAAGASASCPVDVLPFDASAGSSYTPCPGVNYQYARVVYIIRSGDIAVSGLSIGTPVTGIGWGYLSGFAPGSTATASLKIYLQSTNDYNNMKGTDWATAIGTMTKVHDASTTIPAGPGPFEIAFTGGSAFTYSGGGLYVAVDWGQYQGTLDKTPATQATTAGAQPADVAFAYSDTAAPAVLDNTTLVDRWGTRLLVGPQTADAGITALYSLGSLPINEVVSRTFQARVVNDGNTDFANLPVTLAISGAVTSFTDTQTLPSLPHCSSATVTFAPFNPGVTDACTATASVPADAISSNNSVSHPLDVTPDTCSYKYPGPTPNQGLGGGSPVEIDAKFNSPTATKINSAIVEFARASAATYRISVRSDDGTGKPGSVLYMDANDRTIGAAGSVTVPLASIVNVGPGNFFVGAVQTNTTNMTLAFDYEMPIRPGVFYINRGLSGTFADFSPTLPYKPNIGAILGCPAIMLSPASLPSVGMATPYSQTVSASGAPGPYTYAVTAGSLPAGLTLSGTTGVLSGTPTASGTFPFTVTATDASTCTGYQDYSITVTCPAITVSPATLPGSTAGMAYSQMLTAAGGTPPYTFTVTAGSLPAGLTLTSGGVLSGTPTASGTFPFTVTGIDAIGCTGSTSYTLHVACPVIAVSPATIPAGIAGTAYASTTFSQTGGIGTITWSKSGALPTGMTFSAGVLSGTPTVVGSFPITVTATDTSVCTGSQAYTLVIGCQTITVTPGTQTFNATAGAAFSQSFSQTGGIGVTALAESGGLPMGMGFSGTTLSGTPTQAGNFPFTITATDSNGCTGSTSYTLHVACPTMTVGPASIPAGLVGAPYPATTFTQTGGSVATAMRESGALPGGMAFQDNGNGTATLSGTPTTSGTYPFTVTATSWGGCTGTAAYTLQVSAFNLSFLDDLGRYSLCVNSTSGSYSWKILKGTGAGTIYTGTGKVTNTATLFTLSNNPGASQRIFLNYYKVPKSAAGYCLYDVQYMTLVDSNTADDPPCQ